MATLPKLWQHRVHGEAGGERVYGALGAATCDADAELDALFTHDAERTGPGSAGVIPNGPHIHYKSTTYENIV